MTGTRRMPFLSPTPGVVQEHVIAAFTRVVWSLNQVAITLHCTIIIVTAILAILVATWNFSS